ncbi:DUF3747 domain-containing protein [Spirulina sp. CS-785/01]|uniref:DUF3747 domain-containing protein n=1 Tax=Spirulina sp. CS-785/01 TaxID=3021716 RepID=UPI00232D8BA5|nr:DUF3747 domain-containing protein [Spirulina sp. CS-785/01]MDB9311730.1 DUF3747 domain-containing protein [Spirulina sp. CS-785/01]
MKLLHRLAATLATATLLQFSVTPLARAVNFGKVEVPQERFVAIATPFGVGTRRYNLLIIEQISNQRRCWQEVGNNPTQINPLFETFDFSGICGRSTDSNGYSVRLNDQDLGSRLILSVVPRGDELVLVASSLRERNVQVEIGRTNGFAEGYLKIELDPGWRFTKRTYGGKVLGHVYLTSDGGNANVPPPSPPNSGESLPPADREIIFTPSNDNNRPQPTPTEDRRPLPPPLPPLNQDSNPQNSPRQLPPPPPRERIDAQNQQNPTPSPSVANERKIPTFE